MQLYAKGSRVPFWKEIALGEKDTTCNVNFSRALSPNIWDVEYVVLQRPFAFNVSQDMWTVESKGYHFDIYIYMSCLIPSLFGKPLNYSTRVMLSVEVLQTMKEAKTCSGEPIRCRTIPEISLFQPNQYVVSKFCIPLEWSESGM